MIKVLESAFGICFGVTDFYEIIPMRVIETKQHDGGNTIAITEMSCEPTENLNREFEYNDFGRLFLNKKGFPSQGNIFLTRLDATNHCIKKAEKEKEKYQSQLNDINNTLSLLKEEVNDNHIPSNIKNIISKISTHTEKSTLTSKE